MTRPNIGLYQAISKTLNPILEAVIPLNESEDKINWFSVKGWKDGSPHYHNLDTISAGPDGPGHHLEYGENHGHGEHIVGVHPDAPKAAESHAYLSQHAEPHTPAHPGLSLKSAEPKRDYAAKYNHTTGSYDVEHTPSGRIVARDVAGSGGAAMSHADGYNNGWHTDLHLNPTHAHLMDTAHTHQHLKTALHLVKSADFDHASVRIGLQKAVESSSKHVAEVHANFAKNNPGHDHADHATFKRDVEDGHDNLLKSKIEHGEHHD